MKKRNPFIELFKVKSIITLVIISTMAYLVVKSQIEPETFMTVAGSVVTYYFTRRDGENRDS